MKLEMMHRQLHECFQQTYCCLPHQQTLAGSARPNTDCWAISNGVHTKRSMAWVGLLLLKNKVNNNSQTWPLIHLTSLPTFYLKTLLLKWDPHWEGLQQMTAISSPYCSIITCLMHLSMYSPTTPLRLIWGNSGDLTQQNVKCPIVGQI